MELATSDGGRNIRQSQETAGQTAVGRGLLAGFEALLGGPARNRPHPSPVVLAAGATVAVVRNRSDDGHQTQVALEAAAARAGVVTVILDPGAVFGVPMPPRRVCLVVATHHSTSLAAQRHALARDVPVLLPGFLDSTRPLRLWLRPDPALLITAPDGRTGFTVNALHLAAPLEHQPDGEVSRAVTELMLRPTGHGVLTGTADDQGNAAKLLHGRQLIHLHSDTPGTADGEEHLFARGTYGVRIADRGLYRLHIESAHAHRNGPRP
jgi:hypothetical protein